jgi:hypothetical protein
MKTEDKRRQIKSRLPVGLYLDWKMYCLREKTNPTKILRNYIKDYVLGNLKLEDLPVLKVPIGSGPYQEYSVTVADFGMYRKFLERTEEDEVYTSMIIRAFIEKFVKENL